MTTVVLAIACGVFFALLVKAAVDRSPMWVGNLLVIVMGLYLFSTLLVDLFIS